MHGFAWGRSYLVPTASLALPPPLAPLGVGGRTTGLLLYVRYTEPSPLTYHELIWAPALVRAPSGEAGFYIAAIYVDDERSRRGGREIWALPKTLARFDARGGAEGPGEASGSVRMEADDGTSIEMHMRALGPSRLPVPQYVSTLQTRGDRVERFRGSGSGRAGLASVEVPRFSSEHEGWAGFVEARPLPALRLASFALNLGASEVLAESPAEGPPRGYRRPLSTYGVATRPRAAHGRRRKSARTRPPAPPPRRPRPPRHCPAPEVRGRARRSVAASSPRARKGAAEKRQVGPVSPDHPHAGGTCSTPP